MSKKTCSTRRRDHKIAEEETAEGLINPLFFFKFDEVIEDETILIGDGGDFVATYAYIVQPKGPYTWLTPVFLNVMGAGFAMGAKLAKPDHDVLMVMEMVPVDFPYWGDMFRNNIPIIAIVGNDAGWTQIARDQVVILEDDVATTLTYMDYHTVAEGCGAVGLLLKEKEDIIPTLKKAIQISREDRRPVLINVLIGKTDFRKGSISM